MLAREAVNAADSSPLELRRLHHDPQRLVTGAVRFDIFSARFWFWFGVIIHLIGSCL